MRIETAADYLRTIFWPTVVSVKDDEFLLFKNNNSHNNKNNNKGISNDIPRKTIWQKPCRLPRPPM